MDYRLHAERSAEFLGLPLDPSYLDGVAANLALLHAHATRMMSLDLPPDLDGAPVFSP